MGDLEDVEFEVQTPAGGIHFKASRLHGKRELILSIPAGITAILTLDSREKVNLKSCGNNDVQGTKQYEIIGGRTIRLKLKHM